MEMERVGGGWRALLLVEFGVYWDGWEGLGSVEVEGGCILHRTGLL